eukprot:11183105-Lingulodinium_polyedra.AAC.1
MVCSSRTMEPFWCSPAFGGVFIAWIQERRGAWSVLYHCETMDLSLRDNGTAQAAQAAFPCHALISQASACQQPRFRIPRGHAECAA